MKKLKVVLASIMTICATLSVYAGSNQILTASADAYATQFSAPEAPSLNTVKYNTAVAFTFIVGTGGDSLQFSRNNMNWSTINSAIHTIYQFPNIWDHDNRCELDDHLYRSYNSHSGLYSNTKTVETAGNNSSRLYGEYCKLNVINGIDMSKIPYDESRIFPTEFDQTYYVWTHNSWWPKKIKGTIEYNNQISDIEVDIPILGTLSSSVTLDGVTFSLRAGPYRCSVKVDTPNISATDTQFMFGVD